MDFKSKYGEWAIVVGATERIGKAFAFEYARRGMNVILVGKREEDLKLLSKKINEETGREIKIIKEDISEYDGVDKIIKRTKYLDVGLINYVSFTYNIGIYSKTNYSKYEQMYKVNIRSFSKLLHHFTGIFKKRDRGAFVTIGSIFGWTSLPFCAEYAAQKAYIMTLTEGASYELKNTNVDILLITEDQTITKDWFKNKLSDEEVVKSSMYAEYVAKEGLDKLGKKISYIVYEKNKKYCKINMVKERDELISDMGRIFDYMA